THPLPGAGSIGVTPMSVGADADGSGEDGLSGLSLPGAEPGLVHEPRQGRDQEEDDGHDAESIEVAEYRRLAHGLAVDDAPGLLVRLHQPRAGVQQAVGDG